MRRCTEVLERPCYLVPRKGDLGLRNCDGDRGGASTRTQEAPNHKTSLADIRLSVIKAERSR